MWRRASDRQPGKFPIRPDGIFVLEPFERIGGCEVLPADVVRRGDATMLRADLFAYAGGSGGGGSRRSIRRRDSG